MNKKISYTLQQLAEMIGATVVGNKKQQITGLATLQSADKSQLAFYVNQRYKAYLSTTHAAVVLLSAENSHLYTGNKLVCADPYLAYAQLTAFYSKEVNAQGVHPTAVIAEDVVLSDNISIGPHAIIESGVHIGEGVCIGAGSYIGKRAHIGENTRLYPNVVLYHDVVVGKQCIVHSGAVIGADGFGFAPSVSGWQKIYQLGSVQVGNDVEVGANTTIDRGALDDTIIADGVKIDNQVQIAHNVQIGENTAIAAAVAIAGSAVIGKRCSIAGGVGIVGHITLVDDVHVTAMTMVTKSISKPGSYSSGVPLNNTHQWRKNAARFNQLDSVFRQIKKQSK